MKDQYKFAFSYYPSKDSLIIQVKSAMDYDNTNKKWTADAAATVLPEADNNAASTVGVNNFVTVQDLIKGKVRIVTIYDVKESDITLGFFGCDAVADNKTTIDEGLYLIKNKAGKYLAMPIHEDSTYHWVSLEENVNPWDMPSFQWVIEKTRKGVSPSPISIINREFGAAKGTVTSSMQLYNDADAVIMVKLLKL